MAYNSKRQLILNFFQSRMRIILYRIVPTFHVIIYILYKHNNVDSAGYCKLMDTICRKESNTEKTICPLP